MMMMSETFLPSFVITQLRWKHNYRQTRSCESTPIKIGVLSGGDMQCGNCRGGWGAFNPT